MLFNSEILQYSKLTSLALERHLNDLERSGFEYYFDEKEAKRILMFAELCRHWKGKKAGERIKLSDWQRFYFSMLYGWREKGTKRKRFTTSYLEVARKNGKTTMLGIDSLYHLFVERESGSQIWAGATKEEQAKIVVNDTGMIGLATPELRQNIEVLKYGGTIKRVIVGDKFMTALGRDSNTSDGFDPSKGIIDEYHAHKTDDILNVIESGMGARENPTLNIITTAGFNREYPCYENTRKSIVNILKNKVKNDRVFGLIFTLDDDDDWNDESVWKKANPNLDESVDIDFLRTRYQKAIIEGGSKEVDFKTKNLNIWTSSSQAWIKDEIWMKNTHGINPESLKGKRCFGGLDLASGVDLNAFVLFFPDIDGKFCILPFFFIPESKLKDRNEFDYRTAAKEGYLFVTPGNVTDIDFMTAKIIEIVSQYDFVSGAFDRWKAFDGTVQNLQKEGLKLNPIGQGFASQSVSCDEFQKMVNGFKIEHFNNKMLRWMVGNVEVDIDAAGNVKLNKSKSQNKIDGVSATINAIGEWLINWNSGGSFLDNPENDMFI